MKKRYKVEGAGNKADVALLIWRVRGRSMRTDDIRSILPLLPPKFARRAERLIHDRRDYPVDDYQGLWKPRPRPVSEMSREGLVRQLASFRDAWERVTRRNQDMSDERLATSTVSELRRLIGYFYSESARFQAENWLRDRAKHAAGVM